MKHVLTSAGEELVLALIRSKGDDRLLAREPVSVNDLLLPRDETWLRGLRAGALGPDLTRLTMNVLPGESASADRMLGYSIELSDNGRSYRRHYSIHSLIPAALRMARALLKEKEEIKEEIFDDDGDLSFYLTAARPEQQPSPDPAESSGTVRVVRRNEPPLFESAPLDDFLHNSAPLTGRNEKSAADAMPVFVTKEVWDEGHELARAGGEKESAAVWTGRLLRDTRSPEVFLLLDACIKAEHATEEKFKVTFSGETWARVRELLDTRRRRLGRPQERIVGSLHGHNFLPEADDKGQRTCQACPVMKICSRTTAAASAADLEWHRSVFVGQPWALLLVWGHNAREQEEWRLYGLEDGTLAPRTLRLLKE